MLDLPRSLFCKLKAGEHIYPGKDSRRQGYLSIFSDCVHTCARARGDAAVRLRHVAREAQLLLVLVL